MDNTLNQTANTADTVAFRCIKTDIDNLELINEHFAYETRGLSARNAMRAGINLFLQSPELFREYLTPKSVNENYNQTQN